MARVIRADRQQPALRRTPQPEETADRLRALARQRYWAGWADAQQPLQHTIARFLSLQEHHLQALQDALVPLLVESLRRLIPRALSAEPALILEIARPLLQALRSATTIRVRAHPHDAAALRAQLETHAVQAGLPADPALAWGVTVTHDPTLARGSLWLESELGTIDARLETRLARIEETLREASNHTRGHAVESP